MPPKVDVFPAIVYFAPPDSLSDFTALSPTGERPQGTRRLDRCRIALFNGKLYVVEDSPEGPKLVFREDYAAYDHSDNRKVHHVLTASGKIAVFFRDNNCGCGSRLRSWSPFGSTLSSTADPDE